jgi:hypothetical protein
MGSSQSAGAFPVSAHLCPWLTLIEPWWKTLRSLALKGFRFEDAEDLVQGIIVAAVYWNEHRHPYQWRKQYE